MGFLRNLLVEEIPDETVSYDNYEQSLDTYTDEIDVNTENITQENLISDIYNQNNLSDLSKSIFKIEELINSLPKEMSDKVKKPTVLSMLSIFGVTVDEVVKDGVDRCNIVVDAGNAIVKENNDVIGNNNALIEQKKLEIEELEKDNALRNVTVKTVEDKIEAEVKRITELVKFVGGDA